jgi:hypothetical protein
MQIIPASSARYGHTPFVLRASVTIFARPPSSVATKLLLGRGTAAPFHANKSGDAIQTFRVWHTTLANPGTALASSVRGSLAVNDFARYRQSGKENSWPLQLGTINPSLMLHLQT